MTNILLPVSYALRRQQMAVQRVLCARTAEEGLLAARWAEAWRGLVQRKLDRVQYVRQVGSAARRSLRTLH